jgi:hypothetical protein
LQPWKANPPQNPGNEALETVLMVGPLGGGTRMVVFLGLVFLEAKAVKQGPGWVYWEVKPGGFAFLPRFMELP